MTVSATASVIASSYIRVVRGARFGKVVGLSLTPNDRVHVKLDKLPGRKFSGPADRFRKLTSTECAIGDYMTTQKQIRAAFWAAHPNASRRLISYGPHTKVYTTDTRTAFVNFIDRLVRDGTITEALANRATLPADPLWRVV